MADELPDIEFTDHPLRLLYEPEEYLRWQGELGEDEAIRRLTVALRPYKEKYGTDAIFVLLVMISRVEARLKEHGLFP